MKNTSDVDTHRVALEINFIAKNAVDREISKDMLKKEIEHKFNSYSPSDRHLIFNRVMQECYQQVWLVQAPPVSSAQFDIRLVREPSSLQQHEKKMKKTFAMQLAEFIISRVESGSHQLDEEDRFTDGFYNSCATELSNEDFAGPVDDELLLIYVKQLVIILRESGLLKNDRGRACIQGSGSSSELYKKLFDGFWNRCKWEDIFPSAPGAAAEIQKIRSIFIDLLSKSNDGVAVEDIANEFFEMTGVAGLNDTFFISFLDFYLFTWLNHFGVLHYRYSGAHEPVSISMSDFGRWFLKAFQTSE